MSTPPRAKKPRLERTRPIRSWSTLFAETARAEDRAARGEDRAARAEDRAARGAGAAPSVEDALSRSIDLGYRVVDEYVRRGQEAARRLGSRPASLGEVGGDVQDLVSRMGQYASDFAALWVELIEMAAVGGAAQRMATAGGAAQRPGPGMRPPTPPAANAAGPVSAAAPPDERLRVRLEVGCSRPTDVRLDLQPGSGARPIVVHALRAVDPGKPRLSEVSLHPDGAPGAVTLRIRIPDGQPPGIYNGLLVDAESSVPLGTLSVRIAPG